MLLLIHTATETASITLSEAGKILFTEENTVPGEQAAWLHPAIGRLLKATDIPAARLQAVAISAGPGSYTGLRVGMSAAKGLCYGLGIPLIAVNTLELMAAAMASFARKDNALLCPMIDARRDEVFTALYSPEMVEIMAPQALILDKTSFEQYLKLGKLIFSGSGSAKWESMTESVHALFIPQHPINESFAKIAQRIFESGTWADTAYSEPIYLKEFYTHAKK